MALSWVGQTAWVASTGTATPPSTPAPSVGDLVVLELFSKYETATLPADPSGWTSLGVAVNTGLTPGNDAGNLRSRAFYKVWASGDVMPTFAPANNNVSIAAGFIVRSATKFYDVQAALVPDNQAGGTTLDVTNAPLDLTTGDLVKYTATINGDAPSIATTISVTHTGATSGARTASTGITSALGTDIENASWYGMITAGTATAISTTATLGTVTTGTAGITHIIRVREAAAPVGPPPFSGWGVSL